MGVLYRRRSNSNLNVVSLSDVDWTGSSIHKRSTSEYYTFVCGNLVTWRGKKQNVVAKSGVEVEYKAMTHTKCE